MCVGQDKEACKKPTNTHNPNKRAHRVGDSILKINLAAWKTWKNQTTTTAKPNIYIYKWFGAIKTDRRTTRLSTPITVLCWPPSLCSLPAATPSVVLFVYLCARLFGVLFDQGGRRTAKRTRITLTFIYMRFQPVGCILTSFGWDNNVILENVWSIGKKSYANLIFLLQRLLEYSCFYMWDFITHYLTYTCESLSHTHISEHVRILQTQKQISLRIMRIHFAMICSQF